MTYTIFDSEGMVLETGIVNRDAVRSLIDYHGSGSYAEDADGNRVCDDCRNCGAGDVAPWQDCPECGSCNV